mgnify:CR=1 FL=1
MANLRANNLTGTGGRNAINGSVHFGGYIDGTNADWLQTADLDDYDMGSGDFTFECWVKAAQSSGAYAGIFGMYNYDNGGILIQISNAGKIRVVNPTAIDQEGSTVLWGSGGTMSDWHHIAVARSGSTLKAFVNGVEEISHSYSSPIDFATGGSAVIGVTDRNDYPGDYDLKGYISNLRLIKGTALYTAAFTPPTEKLTVIDGTVLLCCQDSMNPEQEATGKTLTGYGNLTVTDNANLVGTAAWTDVSSGSASASGSGTYCSAVGSDLSNRGAVYTSCTVVIGKKYEFGFRTVAGITNCKIGVDSNDGTDDQRDAVGNNPDLVNVVALDSTTVTGRKYRDTFINASTTTADVYFQGINGTVTADEIFLRLVDNSDKWRSNNELPPVGVDEGVTFGGGTKHNTQGYMYFPTGDTSQRGRGRAVFAGGYKTPSAVSNIDYLSILSGGLTETFGNLSSTTLGCSASCSSETRMITGGGWTGSANSNTIEYITIAKTSNSTDFGDLAVGRRNFNAASNGTRGLFYGGNGTPADSTQVDYVNVANAGNAADFGDASQVMLASPFATASSTRALFGGGYAPGGSVVNTIEYFTIASTGNYTNFGDLTSARQSASGLNSSTRSVFGGGGYPTAVNTIDYVTTATTGNASDFGDLSLARGLAGGTSNGTRGIFMGGTTNPARQKTIDSIIIATTGNAVNWGDFRLERQNGGCASDSHGGLS